jgi:CheY-like chemotaxis protein
MQQPRYEAGDSLHDIAHGESILVVEDDRDVRRFIVECLNTFGYQVSESQDGRAGLEALKQAQPDLLIVDFAMPGINGAEMATQVRAERADLPIIFVTGYADMDAVERVTGAKYLLRKPFEVSALADIVRHALSARVQH